MDVVPPVLPEEELKIRHALNSLTIDHSCDCSLELAVWSSYRSSSALGATLSSGSAIDGSRRRDETKKVRQIAFTTTEVDPLYFILPRYAVDMIVPVTWGVISIVCCLAANCDDFTKRVILNFAKCPREARDR